MKSIFSLAIILFSLNSLASHQNNVSFLTLDDSIYDLSENENHYAKEVKKEEIPADLSIDLVACDLCYGSLYSVSSQDVQLIRIFDNQGNIIMTTSYFPEDQNYFEFEKRGKYTIQLYLKDGSTATKELSVFSDK